MNPYDVVVVGSGAGGGTLAYRLVRGGARCLLLEAGREYGPETFPVDEAQANAELFWSGGLDLTADARIGLLRGRCLGGTTVVNQCLLDRLTHDVFDDWRQRTGVDLFSLEEMTRYYERVEGELVLHTFAPEERNRNARIFCQAMDERGYRRSMLRRGQSDCADADCIVCLGGCRRASKQSTLATVLPRAREAGLDVMTEREVERVIPSRTHVHVVVRGPGGTREQVRAPAVVLAAGALGTSQLLLRSGFRSRLPALGHGFFCHPQSMTFGRFDEPVDAHRGAFQTVRSDEPAFRRTGFKLENVFAPPIAVATLLAGSGERHRDLMRSYRHYACIEVAVRDTHPGRITVGRRGKLRVHKKLDAEDRRKAETGLGVVRELFEAAGARDVVESPFTFGLHLMGGCRMGTDPSTSVVDPTFRLHRQPNIFVADSSLFPAAPGINPALTVMALATRAAEEVLV